VARRAREIGATEFLIVSAFFIAIASIGRVMPDKPIAGAAAAVATIAVSDKCKVPDWAVAVGHAGMWKLHNNCATSSR
jgi:hypothetical protein